MVFAKEIAFIISLFFLLFVSSSFAYGADVSWDSCPNGNAITRCQTINCPQGDTNGDGSCTLTDSYAELTSSRNDSLCSNPPSGCGEVDYFESNSTSACIRRVKETSTGCNLYNTSTPRFSPSPTLIPTSTPTPTATPTNKFALGGGVSTPTPKPTAKPILPPTGPTPYVYPALALSGFLGLILFLRFRNA